MRPYKALPFRARVDLGAMVFAKAQGWSFAIVGEGLIPLQRCSRYILQPQQNGLRNILFPLNVVIHSSLCLRWLAGRIFFCRSEDFVLFVLFRSVTVSFVSASFGQYFLVYFFQLNCQSSHLLSFFDLFILLCRCVFFLP